MSKLLLANLLKSDVHGDDIKSGPCVEIKAEVVAFAANAALIRREDQMLGSLLDRQA